MLPNNILYATNYQWVVFGFDVYLEGMGERIVLFWGKQFYGFAFNCPACVKDFFDQCDCLFPIQATHLKDV